VVQNGEVIKLDDNERCEAARVRCEFGGKGWKKIRKASLMNVQPWGGVRGAHDLWRTGPLIEKGRGG